MAKVDGELYNGPILFWRCTINSGMRNTGNSQHVTAYFVRMLTIIEYDINIKSPTMTARQQQISDLWTRSYLKWRR